MENKETKLLIIKDAHFRFGFPHPRGRTPDFEEQIYDKINQVIAIGKQHNIKHLIFTGDTFDVKTPSSWGLDKIHANTDILNKLNEHFIVSDIIGNHSIAHSSIENKSESFQQLMINNNLIQDLTLPEVYNSFHPDIILYGIDYNSNKDYVINQIHHFDELAHKSNKKAILVIHEHLVPTDKDMLPFGHSYTYQQICKDLKAHICIIAGHLHKGYQPQTITNNINNKITIINQWNFTRLSRDYYSLNAEHTPQVTILDLNDIHNPITINLNVKHFDEAFILPELNKEKELNDNITDFINQVNNTVTDIDSELSSIPDAIRERVSYYLEKARGA